MSRTNQDIPEYRSSRNCQIEPVINRSYSTVLTQHRYPSKEQAIIFPAMEEAKLQEYLIPLGEIVNPKNIIYSSRLSNNRICVYFASQSIVDKFMNEHGGIIEMNNTRIQARRYVTPSERIVLSNVCPSIPNEILIKELEKMGITLLSPMTPLRINATLPEFSHILSFRRQVFISPMNTTVHCKKCDAQENEIFFVFVERENIDLQGYGTFMEALKVAFSLYFILDLKYPPKLQATFELLQRMYLKIHPDAGSKSRGKVTQTKKKVLNYMLKFNNHSLQMK